MTVNKMKNKEKQVASVNTLKQIDKVEKVRPSKVEINYKH